MQRPNPPEPSIVISAIIKPPLRLFLASEFVFGAVHKAFDIRSVHINDKQTDSRCHKSVCKNAVAIDDKKLNDRRKKTGYAIAAHIEATDTYFVAASTIAKTATEKAQVRGSIAIRVVAAIRTPFPP